MDTFEVAVFSITLALSVFIGIFFGCVKTTGQNTVNGYLFGGKRMPVLPIALSLVSSYISGIALIGIPSEVYYFSTQYMVVVLGVIFAVSVQVYVALPVFFKLQLVSAFEYMELRFGRRVRTVTSLLYCMSSISLSAIVIYASALAMNQVTGINYRIISIVMSVVCIFYTALGGLKAVVWADTLQAVIMIIAVLAVLIAGVIKSGGNAAVVEAALKGDRIQFFIMDPSARISFWSQAIGMTAFSLATSAFSPPVIQRLICLPSIEGAKKSSWLMAVGVSLFYTAFGYTGLAMYAFYRNCDPYSAKLISHPDQILPYFVMELSTYLKGLSGLFLAGIVAASLSTLSTSINTLAGTIYEDFIEIILKTKPSEETASLVMKLTSCAIGIICVALVGVVERLKYILEVAAGFTGITHGATLGLFLLGVFQPRANNLGGTVGGLTSLIFMTFMLIGNTVNKMEGAITTEPNVLNVTGCPFNVTMPQSDGPTSPEYVFPLFRIPVYYYTAIGSSIVIVVGSIASLFAKSEELTNVNEKCLSPWVIRLVKKPVGRTYNVVPRQDEGLALADHNK